MSPALRCSVTAANVGGTFVTFNKRTKQAHEICHSYAMLKAKTSLKTALANTLKVSHKRFCNMMQRADNHKLHIIVAVPAQSTNVKHLVRLHMYCINYCAATIDSIVDSIYY